MIIGGTDPGNTGAIGVYDGAAGKLIDVFDLPGHYVVISKQKRIRIDEDKLYDLYVMLRQTFDMQLMVVEQVMGMPKQSAPAAFQFGQTYGMIRTTARYAGLQVHDASPGVWKNQMKVPKDAKAICLMAEQRYPEKKDLFWGKRGGTNHDRAEAAMLADYGWHRIWPSLQPRAKLRQAAKGLK